MTEQTISDRLRDIRRRYDDLGERLSDPEVFTNSELLSRYGREQAELAPAAALAEKLRTIEDDTALYTDLAGDGLSADDLDDAKAELRRLRAEWADTVEAARQLLLPKDPNDERNVIVEVRAGTGGEEAALFAAELCRMYGLFAERQGWSLEVLNQSESPSGGV
jgi:peptide chain release factor 1